MKLDPILIMEAFGCKECIWGDRDLIRKRSPGCQYPGKLQFSRSFTQCRSKQIDPDRSSHPSISPSQVIVCCGNT